MSNWSQLPQDLLLIVLEKLDNICDYIRFCSVCSPWRSIGKSDSNHISHLLPCLLLSGKILPITQLQNPYPPKLPVISLPQNSVCRGSYKEWLVILNEDMTMHLQNPISGQQIALPPLAPHVYDRYYQLRCYHDIYPRPIEKAILSSEPISSRDSSLSLSCFVSVICFQGNLFYCKLGDTTWTHLKIADSAINGGFTDVTYHMGQLLALQSVGTIFTSDLNSSWPRLTELDWVRQTFDHSYMVHCGGELLIVRRGTTRNDTIKFEVYKQDCTTKKGRDVKDLGGYALFLGFNQSLAILATGLKGIQANHIYFSHDNAYKCLSRWPRSENDVGIYDLGQSKLKPVCLNSSTAEKTSIWWVPKLNYSEYSKFCI